MTILKPAKTFAESFVSSSCNQGETLMQDDAAQEISWFFPIAVKCADPHDQGVEMNIQRATIPARLLVGCHSFACVPTMDSGLLTF
jgi:hypothetical protein